MKRILLLTCLFLMSFAISGASVFSQEPAPNWTIKPCMAFGPMGAATSQADLIRLFVHLQAHSQYKQQLHKI
ncbi:MAG: hypothetical protein K8R69_05580 [Deltaproteobacteria bacterium]|nr:hypothetical protein [Deltaproteobacteria bacterium]